MDTVRDRVRFVLKKTGWSQRELARRASLPAESHVSLILTRLGENVRPETLRAIARASGVSEAWLLTGRGSPDEVEDASEHTSVMIPPLRLAEPAATYEPVREPVRQRIADLPDVVVLVERAKEISPSIPPWVWEKLLHMSLQLSAPASPVMLSELAAWVHRHEQVYRPREARPATGGQRAAVGAPPPDPEVESGLRKKFVPSDETETKVRTGRGKGK